MDVQPPRLRPAARPLSALLLALTCALWGCPDDPPPITPDEVCDDGRDNDGDLEADCEDTDCAELDACQGPVSFPEACGDGEDNDLDGQADCQDPDCAGQPPCPAPAEACGDGADNDLDGKLDCDDPDCAQDPACPQGAEDCGDGADNDGDGDMDCQDADCAQEPACQGGEDCGDGADNDGDGDADCQDADCDGSPLCQPEAEDCDDGADNDGDGDTDCQDADCAGVGGCAERLCDDGADDDGDGDADCQDADCAGSPLCQPGAEDCDDGADNDDDGDADCQDADCAGSAACVERLCDDGGDDDGDGDTDCDDLDCGDDPRCAPEAACDDGEDNDLDGDRDCQDLDCLGDDACQGVELCGDGADNDDDGEADCDDPDCLGSTSCTEGDCGDGLDDDQDGLTDCDDLDCAASRLCLREGDCGDGADNDNDRAIDCDDADCALDQACVQGSGTCDDPLELDASGVFTGSTEGLEDLASPSCQPDTSQEAVWRLVAPSSGVVCLDTYGTVFDTVLSVREDCAQQGSELVCNDDTEDPAYRLRSQVELAIEADASYFVFVEGFRSNAGDYALRLRQGPCVERLCGDGQDDDDDGERDCADPDCAADPACLPESLCEDQRDNDADGLSDCADPDCLGDPACQLSDEVCDDGRDNDSDRAQDCADPDCAADPACLQSADALPAPGQRVTHQGALDADDPRWARPRVECRSRAPGAYPFEVWALTNRGEQPRRVSVSAEWVGGDGFLHVFRAPFDPRDLSTCLAGNDDLTGAADSAVGPVWVAPGETVYAVPSTLTADGALSAFTLTALTWPDAEQACQDGQDDDANGASDCGDLACAPTEACAAPEVPVPARGQALLLTGSLDAGSPRWARPSSVCTLRNGAHPLGLHFLVNDSDQALLVDVRARWAGDGFLHALRAPFDLYALAGCEAGNDDAERSDESFLEGILLAPGERVAIAASSYEAQDWIGPYELEVQTQP